MRACPLAAGTPRDTTPPAAVLDNHTKMRAVKAALIQERQSSGSCSQIILITEVKTEGTRGTQLGRFPQEERPPHRRLTGLRKVGR